MIILLFNILEMFLKYFVFLENRFSITRKWVCLEVLGFQHERECVLK